MATRKQRRTWPQRLTFVAVVIACIGMLRDRSRAGRRSVGAVATATRRHRSRRRRVARSRGRRPDGRDARRHDHGAGRGRARVRPPRRSRSPSPRPRTSWSSAPTTAVCDDQPLTGDRDDLGERSDTIMIWRANPETNQLAVLSFPRDLYVDIGGRRDRINTAYRRDDPSRLIETIGRNFGVPVDHYVQVDFCAFRELVDAVGGVEVPFDSPARDRKSGLVVTDAGCVTPRRRCGAGVRPIAAATSSRIRPAAGTGRRTARPTSVASPASRTSCGVSSPR